MNVIRSIAELRSGAALAEERASWGWCRPWAPCTPGTSRCFARHAPSAPRWWRACSSIPLSSATPLISQATRVTRPTTVETAEGAGVDLLFAPAVAEDVSAGLRHLDRRREARFDSGGGLPPGALSRRRNHLPEAVQHRPPGAGLLRPERRTAGTGDPSDDPGPAPGRGAAECVRPCATRTVSPCRPATCASALPSGFARSRCRVRWRVETRRRRARCSAASRSSISRWPRSIRPCWQRLSVSARCA